MGDGLGLGTPEHLPPPSPAVCADGVELPGIDVSKWNGDIDWPAVASSGVKYAFIRVSDGTTHFDPKFDENWTGARTAGIHVGVYQFFRPEQDAIAQADLLLQHMGQLGPDDLPPVIDVEANGGLSSAAVATAVGKWIDHVEAATGIQPIVYTGSYFWQDNVGSAQWSDHPLWIAHYTTGCPNLPSQWTDWVFHQYTDGGSVPGISGNVDLNDFNGDLAALSAYLVAPGVCGDATCSGTENFDLCPQDCDPCGVVSPAFDTVIDNGDPCYDLYGDPQYWREAAGGVGGSHVWTNTTTGEAYNYAVWRLVFDRAGTYTLEAHVPGGNAAVTAADYEVLHADGTRRVTIDQAGANGWITLGTFAFEAGGFGQHVRLADLQSSSGDKLVFDALRIVPGDATEPSSPQNGGGGDDDDGRPDDPDDDGDDDAPGMSDDEDDAGIPWGGSRRQTPDGCRVGARSRPPPWMLVLLVAALRRRRGRNPTRCTRPSTSRTQRHETPPPRARLMTAQASAR